MGPDVQVHEPTQVLAPHATVHAADVVTQRPPGLGVDLTLKIGPSKYCSGQERVLEPPLAGSEYRVEKEEYCVNLMHREGAEPGAGPLEAEAAAAGTGEVEAAAEAAQLLSDLTVSQLLTEKEAGQLS